MTTVTLSHGHSRARGANCGEEADGPIPAESRTGAGSALVGGSGGMEGLREGVVEEARVSSGHRLARLQLVPQRG
jgi:hypothetical protein